jgi:type VI secretion system secreted protein Hcp
MPTSYYLKLGASDEQVLGDSRDPHHRGWIKLEIFSIGTQTSGAHGSGGGGGPGKVTISEFHMTKVQDRASPVLMDATSTGRPFKTAVLEAADSKTGSPKLRITLSDVQVSSFNNAKSAGHGSSVPIDEFALSFGGIEINHNPIAEDSIGAVLQSLLDLVTHHAKP